MRNTLLLLAALLVAPSAFGQSTLTAGDLVIVGFNMDNPDAFAFRPLVDLQIGTLIYFTDSGWKADNTGFRPNEGALLYTAPSAITAGSLITFETGGGDPGFTPFGDANVGNNGFNLSGSGDQIIAFQGQTGNPTFLFAVNNESVFSDATNSNDSALPQGLTLGITALALTGTQNNGQYTGALQFDGTNGAAYRNAVANETDWTKSTTRIAGSLPVELTTFTATANGNVADLRWETASETNNTGFEVQMDGGNGFSFVDFVQGAGTTLEATSYAFRVADLAAGSYRFRLKQVDLDGSFEFSPVVELSVAPNGYAFSATSSFRSEAVVDLSVERAQDVTVAVYNLLGRRVATLMSGTVDGSVSLRLDGGSLASGVYFVRAEGETFSATRQVVRVR